MNRDVDSNLLFSCNKLCAYCGNNITRFSHNKNVISTILFLKLLITQFFEFSMGFFHLKHGKVSKQNRGKFFLDNKYLHNYERIMKKNSFCFQRKQSRLVFLNKKIILLHIMSQVSQYFESVNVI